MANLLSTSVYGFLCSAKEESGRRVISFKSGESGWRIKNDGDSEFNRVYARIELATKSLVFGEYDNEINARDHGDLYLGFRNTNQVYIGKDCNVGIGMSPQYKLDVNGDVRSSVFFQAGNYASGWTGNGCRMEAGGKMECTSLWVRGTMNVYELIINQVGATNGSLAVSDSGKVDVVSGFTLRLTGDNNNFNTFRPADYLLCQKFTGRTVKRYIIHVYSISGLLVSFGYAEGGIGINVVEKDDILVRWDSEDATRKGLLYLTSSDSGAPYMDVMHARKTYLRVGNLSGIGRLSGYGIVGRDADLNNVFYISSDSKANIAGWKFDKDALWVGDKQTLSAFTNSGITFSSSGAIRTMSFRSEPNGYTVLGKGNQSIAYNASNGKIEFGSDVSLNWKEPIDSLGDKVSNQGIDINDIGGSLNSLSSVVGTKTTYIDANGIYTGTLTADQVNAINVRGESLSFVKGTIAGLRFSNNALWAGNDEINDTFTGIVFGKDVSLNGVEKTGLFGVKKGITTFSIDADTGDVNLSGDLIARVINAEGLNIANRFVFDKDSKDIKFGNLTILESGALAGGNAIFDDIETYGGWFPTSQSTYQNVIIDRIAKSTTFMMRPNFKNPTGPESFTLFLPNIPDLAYSGIGSNIGFRLTIIVQMVSSELLGVNLQEIPYLISNHIVDNPPIVGGGSIINNNTRIVDNNGNVLNSILMSRCDVLELYYYRGTYQIINHRY